MRAIILLAYVRRRTYEVHAGRDENDAGGLIARVLEIATPVARAHRQARQGYPVPTSKKKRACIATYQHSGEVLFEKSLSPTPTLTIYEFVWPVDRNVTLVRRF